MPIPLIAAAVSAIGPVLAKHGMDMLSGVFRGTVDKGTQEIANLIEEKTGIDINDVAEDKLTDDQWVRLKEFELKHQEQILAYRQAADAKELERERMRHQDRANARDMQREAVRSEDKFVRRFIHIYALVITVLTFVFIFYAAFIHNYAEGKESIRIIDTVLGFLLGVSLSAIIQFSFGSSQGSASKNDYIRYLTDDVVALSSGQRARGEERP